MDSHSTSWAGWRRSFIRASTNAVSGATADQGLSAGSRGGGPQFFVSLEPYRFANYSSADTIAEAVGISEGVDHSIVINNGHSLLFGGYAFTSYFATPSLDNRDTHRLLIGITHELNPRLFAQLFYSWEYQVFQEYDRHDSRHVVGLNMIYKIRQNLFGNISAYFVDSESNLGLGTYQNAIVRSGLNMQF